MKRENCAYSILNKTTGRLNGLPAMQRAVAHANPFGLLQICAIFLKIEKIAEKNLYNDIIFYIFVSSNNQGMRRYKVNEVLKMLEADGWYLVKQKGSHRQYKHPTKKGRVTVNEKPSTTLDQFILSSIWKQAGWK